MVVPVRVSTVDRVCSIVIDRPDKRNAVDLATLRELRDAQGEATSARVVVLSGAPPAFCSGADLGDVEVGEFTDTLLDVLRGFGRMSAITIAAVDGAALGAGTQLAAACDLRVATPSSPFGIPAARLGLAVDRWTVARLGAEAGWSIARRMLLTGASVPASDLVGCFVHRLGDLESARAWAAELAELAPLTVVAHKASLESLLGDAGAGHVSPADADRLRLAAWASADAEEGRRAFREKRPPRFTGS